ncbi:MAG: response regulator transcription factor [Spirochaetales bacterium]|nr:response regulator transcription factor [Spirochaetales bacterium]
MSIQVMLLDDQEVYLEGLISVLGRKDQMIEVVGAFTRSDELYLACQESVPDLVLLDIRMPEENGLEVARKLRERHPDLPVVFLTTFNEKDFVSEALKIGVRGYILKESPVDEMVESIKAVHQGSFIMSHRAAGSLREVHLASSSRPSMDDFNNHLPAEGEQPEPAHAQDHSSMMGISGMTAREEQILKLVIRGLGNSAIAERLSLSEGTVRNYVSRIYDILGVENRVGVMLWAMENGEHLGD